jgi:glycosyltransferase involved in cell wall biosynthesis
MLESVAIVTRTRDRPLFLERAIRSVLAQTYQHWTHIIVNDGGDACAVESTVRQYSDAYAGRSLVVHHDSSRGMEAASNSGIRKSVSSYILIHDDDDSLEPGFLNVTVARLEDPSRSDVAGAATLTTKISERVDGEKIVEIDRSLYRQLNPCIGIDEMARVNPLPPISLLFRRSVYDEIGPFDESLPVLGDWDFNIRLISRYDIAVVQQALANYHLRPALTNGLLANSVHAKLDLHRYFDQVVRNRYMRSPEHWAIGSLMHSNRQGKAEVQLTRLYRHPVLGRIIWLWARIANPSIPTRLDDC